MRRKEQQSTGSPRFTTGFRSWSNCRGGGKWKMNLIAQCKSVGSQRVNVPHPSQDGHK